MRIPTNVVYWPAPRYVMEAEGWNGYVVYWKFLAATDDLDEAKKIADSYAEGYERVRVVDRHADPDLG